LNKKTALTLIVVAVMLSLSVVTAAGTSNNFPNLHAVQELDSPQRFAICAPFAVAAGLQNHLNPLDQPTRLEIYNYVKANPGVHFRGICMALGISIGAAQYHLDILVNAGLLTIRNDGQNKRYFEAQTYTEPQTQLISLLRHETKAKILSVIAEKGAVLHCVLADSVGVSSQALSWQMNHLTKAGYVAAEKAGMSVKYALTEQTAQQLKLLLPIVGGSSL
jgi:predicted transcriptional regulator